MKKFKARSPEYLLAAIPFLATDVARLYRTNFDEKMNLLGLSRSHWWLISFLCYYDGHTQNVLQEVMDIDGPSFTKLVDRLEAAGLVYREVDREDRRFKRVYLTDLAKPIAAKVSQTSDDTIAESLSVLTPLEQERLQIYLKKLRNKMLTL